LLYFCHKGFGTSNNDASYPTDFTHLLDSKRVRSETRVQISPPRPIHHNKSFQVTDIIEDFYLVSSIFNSTTNLFVFFGSTFGSTFGFVVCRITFPNYQNHLIFVVIFVVLFQRIYEMSLEVQQSLDYLLVRVVNMKEG